MAMPARDPPPNTSPALHRVCAGEPCGDPDGGV